MRFKDEMGLTYDDVSLEPAYSEVRHRDEINVSLLCELGGLQMQLPVIAAPMDTVCEGDMVTVLKKHGALGIVHRFNSIGEQAAIVAECGADAAAIGATGDYLERAKVLVDNGVKVLCIDTAHGHHFNMKSALFILRKHLGDDIHLMGGSIATGAAAADLCRWGADSLRVGIGGGSICSTRLQTGFGVPNLTAIENVVKAVKFYNSDKPKRKRVSIIADGGIRQTGDMNKAFAAGADFVMCGSMFAGTNESPGSLEKDVDGSPCKTYRGMASREAQQDWRGFAVAPEGISVKIPWKGTMNQILTNIAGNIRSGFSYVGATNIEEFRENTWFRKQTLAGTKEGETHIRAR